MSIQIELPTDLIIETKISTKNMVRINNDFEYWWTYIITGNCKTNNKKETIIIDIENILHKRFKKATKYTSETYLPSHIKQDKAYIIPIGYEYDSPLNIQIPNQELTPVTVKQKHGKGKGQGKIITKPDLINKKVQIIFYDNNKGDIDEILQLQVKPTDNKDKGIININQQYVGRNGYIYIE